MDPITIFIAIAVIGAVGNMIHAGVEHHNQKQQHAKDMVVQDEQHEETLKHLKNVHKDNLEYGKAVQAENARQHAKDLDLSKAQLEKQKAKAACEAVALAITNIGNTSAHYLVNTAQTPTPFFQRPELANLVANAITDSKKAKEEMQVIAELEADLSMYARGMSHNDKMRAKKLVLANEIAKNEKKRAVRECIDQLPMQMERINAPKIPKINFDNLRKTQVLGSIALAKSLADDSVLAE